MIHTRAKWFLGNGQLQIQRRDKNTKHKQILNFSFLNQTNVANKSLIKIELWCNTDMEMEDI